MCLRALGKRVRVPMRVLEHMYHIMIHVLWHDNRGDTRRIRAKDSNFHGQTDIE